MFYSANFGIKIGLEYLPFLSRVSCNLNEDPVLNLLVPLFLLLTLVPRLLKLSLRTTTSLFTGPCRALVESSAVGGLILRAILLVD
jgi:hypothetical protein